MSKKVVTTEELAMATHQEVAAILDWKDKVITAELRWSKPGEPDWVGVIYRYIEQPSDTRDVSECALQVVMESPRQWTNGEAIAWAMANA